MSLAKDRVRVVAVYTAPRTVSREQTRNHFESVVDEFVALPVFQRNVLRYELMMPNDTFDMATQFAGFAAADVSVVTILECENMEKVKEIVHDPEYRKLIEGANAKGAVVMRGAQIFGVECILKK